MYRGKCCVLVNDIVNSLMEHGELDPEAEVNIFTVYYVIDLCYFRVYVM